jgi:hypothetical protein
VDELRGAMLRMGAHQGLLVTTATFSPAAIEAAQTARQRAPIRLVDGAELARLLRKHEITIEPTEARQSALRSLQPARNRPSPQERRPLLVLLRQPREPEPPQPAAARPSAGSSSAWKMTLTLEASPPDAAGGNRRESG